MSSYITAVASFLPGLPVNDDQLDAVLGPVDGRAAKTRTMVLKNNGIRRRYYALDPATGTLTHTNAQLAAAAVRRLTESGFSLTTLQGLCCGTSSPDQFMPGHASMVHGELDCGPCEVVSTAGICLAGVTAMKYIAMAVDNNIMANGVATGSELASTYLASDFFGATRGHLPADTAIPAHAAFSFAEEFLRWMLSDGAGAVLIQSAPTGPGPSLRIDWIELLSHAHRLPTCMYAGAVKEADGRLTGWREFLRGAATSSDEAVMTVKQDARLLGREVIKTLVTESLAPLIKKYALAADRIDWFLPHYSSDFFRKPLYEALRAMDFEIPFDRWFTNLSTCGNTGSASFFIMLDELVRSGRLRPGQRLLGFVPESGRFSAGYLHLQVV